MKLVEKIKYHIHGDLRSAEELFYKTANIYRRPDGYYFIPLALCAQGGIVESSPIIKQNFSSRLTNLGESLLACLLQAQDSFADSAPSDSQANKLELTTLDSASLQTGFHTTAVAVLVQCYVGRVVFHPMRKKGSRTSYYGNPDATFEISTDSSMNELGKALRTSFSLAET